jgi:hypothetical protein
LILSPFGKDFTQFGEDLFNGVTKTCHNILLSPLGILTPAPTWSYRGDRLSIEMGSILVITFVSRFSYIGNNDYYNKGWLLALLSMNPDRTWLEFVKCFAAGALLNKSSRLARDPG